MGDGADYLLDQMFDEFDDEFDDDSDFVSFERHPTCRGCKSRNVDWKETESGQWYLVNHRNGKPHKCGKYQLPMEILKELAIDNLKRQKIERADKLFNTTLNYNGINKVVGFLSNEELLDLYTRWVEYAKSDELCNSNGYRIYDGKVKELKNELIKRL